jgi:hypothetical protein
MCAGWLPLGYMFEPPDAPLKACPAQTLLMRWPAWLATRLKAKLALLLLGAHGYPTA